MTRKERISKFLISLDKDCNEASVLNASSCVLGCEKTNGSCTNKASDACKKTNVSVCYNWGTSCTGTNRNSCINRPAPVLNGNECGVKVNPTCS